MTKPSPYTRRFRICLILIVLLSLGSYAIADQRSVLFLLAAPGAIAGWWLTELLGWAGAPRWAALLLLLGAIGRGVFEFASEQFGISPFAGFLCAILVLKLWEKRQLRDYSQIMSISLFLNIAAVLTSNTLPVGLVLVVVVPLLVYTVMLLQVFAGERAGERMGVSAGGSVTGLEMGDERRFRAASRHLATLAAFAIVLASAISLVVFILVPRGVGSSVFGDVGRPFVGHVTGFSDHVQLGRAGLISQSQSVVMDIRVLGEKAPGLLYLRGAVLDRYSDGAWTRRERPGGLSRRMTFDEVQSGPEHVFAHVAGPQRDLQVRLRSVARGSTPLFSLWRPVSMAYTDSASKVRLDYATCILERSDGPPGSFDYRVTCAVGNEQAQGETGGAEGDDGTSAFDDRRTRARQVPAGTPQVLIELARSVLEPADVSVDPSVRPWSEDARAVRVLETYLRTNYTYTLDILAAPRDRDPTEWFLLTRKTGHCEYFASALASLCRAIGVEARVVTGYLAAEFDDESGQYLVRESNAHAWIEARVGPPSRAPNDAARWRTYDGTPTDEVDRLVRPREGAMAAISRLLDRLESAWADRVIGFDRTSRDRLLGGARGWSPEWLARVTEAMVKSEHGEEQTGDTSVVVVLIAIAAGVVASSILVVVIRRVFRRHRARAEVMDLPRGPESDLYRQAVGALAGAGFKKPPWRSPRDHAGVIRKTNPAVADRFERVVEVCYQRWFAERDATPDQWREARDAVRVLRGLRRVGKRV